MLNLSTPQKQSHTFSLPPKPWTPKSPKNQCSNSENSYVTPVKPVTPFSLSHFQSTPITILKSHNTSPSHRRSIEVISNSENSKSFHDYIIKIEADVEVIKEESEKQAEIIVELQRKLEMFQKKLVKKVQKIRALEEIMSEMKRKLEFCESKGEDPSKKLVFDENLMKNFSECEEFCIPNERLIEMKASRIRTEVSHLNSILNSFIKTKELDFSSILFSNFAQASSLPQNLPLLSLLDSTLQTLSLIRSSLTDLSAEIISSSCRIS